MESQMNRRRFLQVASVGAAAIAIPNLSCASMPAAKSDKKLNFVFVLIIVIYHFDLIE